MLWGHGTTDHRKYDDPRFRASASIAAISSRTLEEVADLVQLRDEG
jgi:hypothetical protein